VLSAGLLSVLWHRLMGAPEAGGLGIEPLTADQVRSLSGSALLLQVASCGLPGAELAADVESIFFRYASLASPSGAGKIASASAEPSALYVGSWAWRRLMTDIGLVQSAADRAEGGAAAASSSPCPFCRLTKAKSWAKP
jgi:hypothetical protein